MKIVKLIPLFLSLSFSIVIHAQTYRVKAVTSTDELVYLDLNGDIAIYVDYYSGYDFTKQGVALTSKYENKDFYLIDTSGNVIQPEVKIKPILNEWTYIPYGFTDGMLRTKKEELLGAVNTEGKLTVPIKYNELTEFNSNHALGLKKKTYYVINKQGDEKQLKYEKIKQVKHFSEGLAPIKIGKYMGFVDTLGNLVIDAKFKSVGYFNGGLVWAKSQNNLVGFINSKGIWIIKPIYFTAKNYDAESGLARVKGEKGWGYVDTTNTFNNFNIKENFYSFSEGLAVARINDKVGYINNKGTLVIPAKFHVAHAFVNGYARVKYGNLWGIIDKKGNWIITPQYKEISDVVVIE